MTDCIRGEKLDGNYKQLNGKLCTAAATRHVNYSKCKAMGKSSTEKNIQQARRVMKTLNFNTELKNPNPLGLEMWKIAFSESERERETPNRRSAQCARSFRIFGSS